MHAFRAGLGNISQTNIRRVLPLQAGLAIKYNRQEGNEGQRTCPTPLKVTDAGQLRPQPQVREPLCCPPPAVAGPRDRLPGWAVSFHSWRKTTSSSLPPNTLDVSKTVPSFRSHIKSASFLLRQQDLPTKQAAGTRVFVTQRPPLKRAAVNH